MSALDVAAEWFAVEPREHNITRIYEPHIDPYLAGNAWLVRGTERDALLDTCTGIAQLRPVVEALTERPVLALALNCLYDHAGSLHEFDTRGMHRLDAPAMAHPTPETSLSAAYVSDAMLRALPEPGYTTAAYTLGPAPATELFEDGDEITLGGRSLRVLHLPGWTAGSMGIWEEETELLFTSDTLYDDAQFVAKQYDEPPYADAAGLADSLARLRQFPASTVHGRHFESFERERMIELIDGLLDSHAGPASAQTAARR